MTGYLVSAIKEYGANYSGLPRACWQGISLTFVNAISIGLSFFLSLYFVNTLHIKISTAGLLISCYGLGTIVGGIIGGKLSDKISPKILSVISLFGQSITFFLLIELKTVTFLMLNLFILGIVAYGFKTSNNVWLLSQCHSQSKLRLRVISISHVASNLGLGLSGIIIGAMSGSGFHDIFFLLGLLLFLSAIYLLFFEKKRSPIEWNNKVNDSHDTKVTSRGNNKIVLLMLVCVFSVGLIIAQLSSTYPIYVERGFPQLGMKAVSILFLLDTILIVIFQAPLSEFFNECNKILVVGTGAFLMGLGMLILSFSFTFFLAIISCVIWTTGEMLFISTAQLVCYENGAEKKKGQSLGIFQAAFASSSVIGPTIGGMIYQSIGGNMLWYISAMIGAICLGACGYYRNYG